MYTSLYEIEDDGGDSTFRRRISYKGGTRMAVPQCGLAHGFSHGSSNMMNMDSTDIDGLKLS